MVHNPYTKEQVERFKDIEKFISGVKVVKSGCWEWQRTLTNGYGVISKSYKTVRAHRFSYELFVGKLIKGLSIDHLCRNRKCVNPRHLEQVTYKKNILRGEGVAAKNAKKTECKYGHKLIGENIIWRNYRNRIGRQCRECNAIATKKSRAESPEKQRETNRKSRLKHRAKRAEESRVYYWKNVEAMRLARRLRHQRSKLIK